MFVGGLCALFLIFILIMNEVGIMEHVFKLIAITLSFLIYNNCWSSSIETWSVNGHQYQVINSPSISWDESRTAAQNLGDGWDLVTITSVEEQTYIAELLGAPPSSLTEYYTGGRYLNGSWGWVTDESFTYSYWGNSEPNGNAAEPYIALDSRFNTNPNWGWNDFDGIGNYFNVGFVAEKHVSAVPEPTSIALVGLGLAGIFFQEKRKLLNSFVSFL